MGERVLLAGRRRPWIVPTVIAAACAIATYLTANAENLPIHDPDGVGGPPLVRMSAILALFIALDVLPRAAFRGRLHPQRSFLAMRAVVRERWWGRRILLVLVGLFSFYITYVAYRNFKGFLPFLRPERHDTTLLQLDKAIFFGHDPATLLHSLLGTGIANEILSAAYVFFLAFVPISLAASLVWFGEMRKGLWYATALCVNWVLGAISYYLIPAMGPAFVAPQLFSDLAPSASSSLQHSLWVERLNVLYGHAPGPAKDIVQSIAAFASLHVSVVLTAALVAHLVRANKWLRIGLWTYFGVVVIATVYLGWHYVTDDLAGVLIAVMAVTIGAVATGHPVRGVWRRERDGGSDGPRGPGGGGGEAVVALGGGGTLAAPARVVGALEDAPARVVGALNLPNVLSGGRILLAPVVAAVMLAHPEGSLLAAALFAAGGLTDVLDGYLARSRGLITPLGKLLDPAADKLLVIAALASLVAVDRLAVWVVGIIAAREVLVTLLRAHAVRRGIVIAAGAAGKVKMGLQVAMVLALMAVGDPFAGWVQVLVAATVVLTVLSGLDYLRAYVRGESAPAVPARV